MPAPRSLDIVFLWHMHQPDYRDRVAGEFRLPWVYLHAIKDYSDMAGHLERHPGVHAVVNFVPVLLEQIEDYADQFASGQFRDPLLRLLGRSEEARLTPAEREFVLEACFRSNHVTMVEPFPRYRRLLDLFKTLEAQGNAALNYLSDAYFHDLLTWYHLAWTGETERRSRQVLAELMAKGEGYGTDDRLRLRAALGEIVSGIVPRYRALAERGQIELSATPQTHPLAPLMLDFASAHEAAPQLALPEFHAYPGGRQRVEDHVRLAMESHAARFGAPPTGLWPAEGAVSAALLQTLAAQGCRWAASSETVLANSLRRGDELPPRNQWLYRPWRSSQAQEVALFFRDERLSDMIGFEYARWHGKDAAVHLVGELENILHHGHADSPPVVSIMLDGENAWEYYPYNGFYFFEDLYEMLERHARIRTTTPTQLLAGGRAAGTLERLVAGSWVFGTFSTWIGDPDKNRAWDLLCAAKQSYDLVMASGRLDEAQQHAATAQLAVCESSDWFWWFGDYNPSNAVASFDRLFRLNLRRLYEMLRLPPPAQLDKPISRGGTHAESGGAMRRAA
ncbi:MAG: glycoside hydrolase [Betaproteobacteria bacterium]|nr:glycoside hydrolase [Betaproteobacteria bacterium]